MYQNKIIDNRIQEILEQKGKTQGWLASRLGINKGNLSKMINDKKRKLYLLTAFKIARALGRGVDEVFIYENGDFKNGDNEY